ASANVLFGQFVDTVYLPLYKKRWKRTTYATNQDRMRVHLIPEFGATALGKVTRDSMQGLLDRKAGDGLSYSVVAHLRWDLNQVMKLAQNEGYIDRNPAQVLF